MNNVFDFFDNIYCINLPTSTTRREKMKSEFSKIGILNRVNFISATKPNQGFNISNMKRNPVGEMGCNLSHIKAVIDSLTKQGNVLIFEDDVVFFDETTVKLGNSLNELPVDWDVFYLSGRPRRSPIKYSNNLVKPTHMVLANAYAISEKSKLGYVNYWLNSISSEYPNAVYDIILSNYASITNSYCAYPIVSSLDDEVMSDITGTHNEHIGGSIVKHVAEGWQKFPPIEK